MGSSSASSAGESSKVVRKGEHDAIMNIKTGKKTEKKFPTRSCVFSVMNTKQVRGVVMGYGGLSLKTSIISPQFLLQNPTIERI